MFISAIGNQSHFEIMGLIKKKNPTKIKSGLKFGQIETLKNEQKAIYVYSPLLSLECFSIPFSLKNVNTAHSYNKEMVEGLGLRSQLLK